MRILVVEDDRDMNSVISCHLSSCGYTVDSSLDGEKARQLIEKNCYDVIVLDIMLPQDSGLEIVCWMRRQGINSATLFLTAKDSIEDRIIGLDSGADDYMTKPFALDELSARVRALSRRLTENRNNVYQIADLSLDIKARTARRGDRVIQLSLREFSILEYLMRNAGIVLTREQIENYFWNYDYIGNSNIVEVYVSALRRKIDSGYDKKLIYTIRSIGYTIRE